MRKPDLVLYFFTEKEVAVDGVIGAGLSGRTKRTIIFKEKEKNS